MTQEEECVMGYLSASLVDGILTVTYKPTADSEFEAATERMMPC